MADHSYFEELIGSQLDGELTEEESAALAAHLRECDACRRYRAFLRSVSEAIPGETVTPPDTLSRAVMARVRALPKETAPERKGMTWGKQRAALSAVAAVIVLGSFAAVRLGTMRAGSAAPAEAPMMMAAPAVGIMRDSVKEAAAEEECAPADSAPTETVSREAPAAPAGAAEDSGIPESNKAFVNGADGAPLAPAAEEEYGAANNANGISPEELLLTAVSGDEPAAKPERDADLICSVDGTDYTFWYEGERLLFAVVGADACFESPLSVSEFLSYTGN